MKVGLYVFGGPTIGTGHLFRCVALSKWFERNFEGLEVVFELIDSDPCGVCAVKDIISSRCDNKIFVHNDWIIENTRWDVLVVDCLQVDPDIMRDLGQRTDCLVSIDNVGVGRFEADIALNPLYGGVAAPHYARLEKDMQGIEYQILSPAFSVSPSSWRETPVNLLVMLLEPFAIAFIFPRS